MSSYLIGNMIGRLIMSALIIYVIILIFNRFNASGALRKMKSPWSWASVILVFMMGLASSVHAAEQKKILRPFDITEFPGAGLTVYVPSRPKWQINTEQRQDGKAILLSTPPQYYPPAVIEITLIKSLRLTKSEFSESAVAALNISRTKAGIKKKLTSNDLKPVRFGKIEGLADQYDISAGNQTYTLKTIMAMMPSGKPVLLSLATAKGQIDHVQHMATKVWSNLRELQPDKKAQ